MDLWILIIRVLLFALFISLLIFFIGFARIKWRMRANEKAMGFKSINGWQDGYPPPNIPRGWITEGMRIDKYDSTKVIPTWKYNSSYYQSLL